MDEKTIIKNYILSDIIKDQSRTDLDDNEKLITGGIIDSMEIMKLLSFLEEEFDIQIAGDELVMENFETIESITQLVKNKR